jgi:2-methylisocitrate lyase-like PEP mutase family enzyme
VWPTRGGPLGGLQLSPPAEMGATIRVATDARRDADFVLIARTDALAVEGLERAVERAGLYGEAGADMLFVEAPGPEHIAGLPVRLAKPAVYNMATSGKTPLLNRAEIAKMGFKLILYPNWMLLAAIQAASSVLETLKREESIAGIAPQLPDFRQFFDLVGMQDIRALEERYGVPEDSRLGY